MKLGKGGKSMTTETRRQFVATMAVPSLALPRIGRAQAEFAARHVVEGMVKRAAEWFLLSPEDITGPRKFEDAVVARWCVWMVLRDQGWTTTRIARAFGRDHATVSHDLAKCRIAMRHERELVDAVAYVQNRV